MTKVFISYPREYESWATWLAAIFKNTGLDVYYQQENSQAGASIATDIAEALHASSILCPIYGPAYFSSGWCKTELENFYSRMMTASRESNTSGGRSDLRIVGVQIGNYPPHIASHLTTIDLREFPQPNDEARARVIEQIERIDVTTSEGNNGCVIAIFEEFSRELVNRGIQIGDYTQLASPIREPNFLLFLRDHEIVMAVSDSQINPNLLQRTDEPQLRSTLVDRSQLARLGFDAGFVHPMFRDPEHVITKICLDATLWFQALYFPNSLIRLPYRDQGKETKLHVPIQQFLQLLLHFIGEDRILIASISKRASHRVSSSLDQGLTYGKWREDCLYKLLQDADCFSRFAPTPSNGLHFGNVRAALLPYLLYRRKIKEGMFFLRFDDTQSQEPLTSDALSYKIQGELKWLGIHVDRQFHESDPQRQNLYSAVMKLLLRYDYAIPDATGNISLNWEHPELRFGAWIDLTDGPHVCHAAPITTDRRTHKKNIASLVLAWQDSGRSRYTYKLCGTVDDLLLSTHVFRDIRQKENTLTSRQAMIGYAIRRAWERAEGSPDSKVECDCIRSYAANKNNAKGPFPLMVPPIYIHVPILKERDEKDGSGRVLKKGRILRKRDRNSVSSHVTEQRFFVDCAQEQDRRLPETVISYLLSTIIPPGKRSILEHRRTLGIMAGQLGVRVLIDIAARRISLDDLRENRRRIDISIRELEIQERYVLGGMTYPQFLMHVREFYRRQEISPDPTEDVLRRLYPHLPECSSWNEVMSIVSHRRSGLCASSDTRLIRALREASKITVAPSDFISVFRTYLDGDAKVAEACSRARALLTGLKSGVPLLRLASILEPEITRMLGDSNSESR